MAWRWIGVGSTYPSETRALRMGAESPGSEKPVKAVAAFQVERSALTRTRGSKTIRAIRAVQFVQGMKKGPGPPRRLVAHASPITCFRREAQALQALCAQASRPDQGRAQRMASPVIHYPSPVLGRRRRRWVRLLGFLVQRPFLLPARLLLFFGLLHSVSLGPLEAVIGFAQGGSLLYGRRRLRSSEYRSGS